MCVCVCVPCIEFELGSPCPFPTTINLTKRAPPYTYVIKSKNKLIRNNLYRIYNINIF